MLSDQQIEFYKKNGFVVPDFSISNSDLVEIRELQEKFIHKYPEFRDYCSTLLAYETGFLRFLKIPEIISMVSQIIGENIALWNSSLFSKPAHNGLTTPWHQDGEYWPISPLATCSVWVAVDDANRENGCLRVIKGSHKNNNLLEHETNSSKDLTLNLELKKKEYDESKAVDIVLEKGQISIHDVFLVHGSEPNTSDKSRRGMVMRFMPTSSFFDLENASEHFKKFKPEDDERKIYHMRGIDQCGKNNLVYV